MSDTFVAGEEKGPVLDDRASDSATENIAQSPDRFRLSARSFNVIQRIQISLVAMIFESGAVELIGAALGHNVNHCSQIATVLG